MSGVFFLLLDLGEWLGKSAMWLADDPQVLVVLAGALGMGA